MGFLNSYEEVETEFEKLTLLYTKQYRKLTTRAPLREGLEPVAACAVMLCSTIDMALSFFVEDDDE